MIFRENMLKDGRLFAKDTDVIPIRIEESRAKEISNEFTKLLKSFFSKTKASDLFRDLCLHKLFLVYSSLIKR